MYSSFLFLNQVNAGFFTARRQGQVSNWRVSEMK